VLWAPSIVGRGMCRLFSIWAWPVFLDPDLFHLVIFHYLKFIHRLMEHVSVDFSLSCSLENPNGICLFDVLFWKNKNGSLMLVELQQFWIQMCSNSSLLLELGLLFLETKTFGVGASYRSGAHRCPTIHLRRVYHFSLVLALQKYVNLLHILFSISF
jgi:hypothetical protein